jgi:DNA-binding NarL/FixJ family response regulator
VKHAEGFEMDATWHVLSIGSDRSCGIIRDALLLRCKCRLVAMASYQGLFENRTKDEFDIAILDHTLSACELRKSTEYIRRHWPDTKIVLMSANADALDDPLYDERVLPDISPELLLSAIDRLAKNATHPRTTMIQPPYV